MKTKIRTIAFGLLIALLPFSVKAQGNEKDEQYRKEHPSVSTPAPAKQSAQEWEKDKKYAAEHPSSNAAHLEPAEVKEQSLKRDEMYSRGELKAQPVPATEVKKRGSTPVVKPTGKEAGRSKTVEHAKRTGPTPVVRPTGKEAATYKAVEHKKHTGPTPVVRPSGKEAERNATKKQ